MQHLSLKTANNQYAIHSGEGSASIVIDKCKINGWNSFGGTVESLVITNCEFYGADDTGRNGLLAKMRPYCKATISDCKFSEEFIYDGKKEFVGLDVMTQNNVVYKNCSVITPEGKKSERSFLELFSFHDKDLGTDTTKYEIEIDGEKYCFVSSADGLKELSKALSNGEEFDGKTVVITNDIGSEVCPIDFQQVHIITVKDQKSLVIDLNGSKLWLSTSVNGETSAFRVENGGELTINDSKGSGAVYYLDKQDNTGGFVVCSAGKFTLNGGLLENITKCQNSAIQGAVDVHANEWGPAYTEGTVFNMNGGELRSKEGNTLRMYDSSQVSNNVKITVNIAGGRIYGLDAVFIQPQYTGSHFGSGVSSGERTNFYSLNISGGEFDSTNGIRIYSSMQEKGTTENNDRGIRISVSGGSFNKFGVSDKARDSHGIAMQNNTISDSNAVVVISSYLVGVLINSGININP